MLKKHISDYLKSCIVYRFPQEFQEMNDADVFHTYLKSPTLAIKQF